MCFIPLKRIRFYREENRWYADIPDQDKEDNEMIGGSKDVLELLYRNFAKKESALILDVSLKKKISSPIIKIVLQKMEEDEEGATYVIKDGYLARRFEIKGEKCWLCNVTKAVFNYFPDRISIIHIF